MKPYRNWMQHDYIVVMLHQVIIQIRLRKRLGITEHCPFWERSYRSMLNFLVNNSTRPWGLADSRWTTGLRRQHELDWLINAGGLHTVPKPCA